MIRRELLERLLLFSARHHRGVMVASLAVVAVSIGLATRLRLDADVLSLLPHRNHQVQVFRENLELFGSIDYFVVGVRIPEGAPIDPYIAFGDALAERMGTTGLFTGVENRLGEPEEMLREVFPSAVLFLDAPARDALAARLTDAAIARRAQELRRQLEMPQAMALRELIKLDPLGLTPIVLERIGGVRGPLALDWTSGRYLSRDHRLLLVLGKPVKSPQDLAFNQTLVAAIAREIATVRAGWPEIAAGATLAPPETFFGGRYVNVLDDEQSIREDVVWNLVSSLGGLLFLFYLAYRRRSLLVLAILPLLCGVAVTFGFAALTIGVLSSTTAGVAALLFGLGDDFVIVLYGRYVQMRRGGLSLEAAMADLGGATARGVVMGAFTTAACFFAFLVTDFTGAWQMGLMIGSGILFCLIAVLVMVPAMLAWGEEHHRKRDRQPRLQVFGFGAGYLVRAALRWPRATLVASVAVTAIAVVLLPRLQFDDSVDALRPAGNRGVLAQQEINRHFAAGFDSMSLVVSAPTLGETLSLVENVAGRARTAVARGELGGFDAVTSVLPPPRDQQEALAWLADARRRGLDPAHVREVFGAAVAAEGLRAEPFREGFDLLARALAPPGPITRETLLALPQGQKIVERYLRQVDGGWKSVVKVYPLPGRPKREIPRAAVDLAAGLGPGVELTGMNVLSKTLRHEIRRDATISALIGILLVLVLLALDFRRPSDALLALVPLLIGLVWMGGAMVVFDFHMNYMNIFVVTMIIGVAVDYGIHIVHRYREDTAQGADPVHGLEETARALLLAVLTTIVGFGSIATSHYPGLVSMGVVATLGTLAAALVAMALVPACLKLRDRPRRSRA